MGARNVGSAFTAWADLPHAPFRLLVGMALQALDAPTKEGRPARVYFGGEDGMVDILGRSRSQMYEALARLREVGAVTILEAGRSRHRAVYLLNLDPFQGPGNPDAIGSRKPGRQGSGKPGHTGSRKPGPLGRTEGATGKSRPGETSPPEVPHQAAGPAEDKADIDYSTASQIVQAALGIEAAAARIRELAVDGTDYTTAMVTLAHQITEAKR